MKFFDFCGVKPEETLAWTAERAEDELLRFKHYLVGEGYSGQTVLVACSAVKRWFEDNRVRLTVRLRGIRKAKTYLDTFRARRMLNACLTVLV